MAERTARSKSRMFQLTAARRRLVGYRAVQLEPLAVSTHSRPKAAGAVQAQEQIQQAVSTHSRPKAAGYTLAQYAAHECVSTHSRPKAAGFKFRMFKLLCLCFNSQPPEGGWAMKELWQIGK